MNIFTEIANITTNKELNAVIEAINTQATIVRAMESAKAKVGLMVGSRVILEGKKNKGVEGVITKMKRSRAIVKVREPNGERLWDCPFSMLTEVV